MRPPKASLPPGPPPLPLNPPAGRSTTSMTSDDTANPSGEDGTMVVVNAARRHLNATLDVVVTRVLQTAAGRIVFAHPKGFT